MKIKDWGFDGLGFGACRAVTSFRCAGLALALLPAACGGVPTEGEEPTALAAQGIEWGVDDSPRPAVGRLLDGRGQCTATVLPHVSSDSLNNTSDIVLSAAHCSDQLAAQSFYRDDGAGGGVGGEAG